MSTPSKISLLPFKKQKKLFDKVVELKLKGFSNAQIGFNCDISQASVTDILRVARKYNPNIPAIVRRNQHNTPQPKLETNLTDLSSYNKETPFTRLFTDPNKIIETEPVTKQLHVTKDFWLFKS
jgi:hypothetical protein